MCGTDCHGLRPRNDKVGFALGRHSKRSEESVIPKREGMDGSAPDKLPTVAVYVPYLLVFLLFCIDEKEFI